MLKNIILNEVLDRNKRPTENILENVQTLIIEKMRRLKQMKEKTLSGKK